MPEEDRSPSVFGWTILSNKTSLEKAPHEELQRGSRYAGLEQATFLRDCMEHLTFWFWIVNIGMQPLRLQYPVLDSFNSSPNLKSPISPSCF